MPAVGDQWVYVPMLSGSISAYKLPDIRLGAGPPPPTVPQPKAVTGAKAKDNTECGGKPRERQRIDYGAGQIEMMNYTSFAPVTAAPLVTRTRLAWATSRGQLYLGFNDRPLVDNRFDTLRPIEAPLMYWPPFIYAASRYGYVYSASTSRSSTRPGGTALASRCPNRPWASRTQSMPLAPMPACSASTPNRVSVSGGTPGIRRFPPAPCIYAADNTGCRGARPQIGGRRSIA